MRLFGDKSNDDRVTVRGQDDDEVAEYLAASENAWTASKPVTKNIRPGGVNK